MTNDTTPKRSEWLILSDTHGNTDCVRRVLSLCAPVDGILFLGDGEHDMEVLQQQYPALPVVGVRGNCDFFSRLPVARVCTVAGHTLWLTHGHAWKQRPLRSAPMPCCSGIPIMRRNRRSYRPTADV